MKSLFLFLWLTGAACLAGTPAVDQLSPDQVAKAVGALKANYVRPDALSDAELSRATLQGLLDRLAPAVTLVSGTTPSEQAASFYSELFQGKTGYIRLGALTPEDVAKAKAALEQWSGSVGAVVLDLRGTPPGSDFATGASLAELFCAKGTDVFSLNSGRIGPSETKVFSAASDPVFKAILVEIVDGETAEAPEAVAASLQKSAKALVVGGTTAGGAYQFTDVPLDSGMVLRVAVARVMLADGKELGDGGLKPDISVGLDGQSKDAIMKAISMNGITSVITEHDRPHLNEAALVSGSNPEVDELEAEQSQQKAPSPLIDRQLEHALDLVTSISIYQAK